MNDSRVLLLDVMGTLVHDPFFVEVPAFFGVSFDELLRVKHPTAWIEFELGRIDEAEFLPKFFQDGRAYDHLGLKLAMQNAYAFLEGVEDLLEELQRRGAAMHALSNYTAWYRLIEARVGLSRYLPWTFVSCETGLRKPDPASFQHAARALGVQPADCLLIDDRETNCAAARGVGMTSIRFCGARSLRSELTTLGVL